MRYSNCVEDPGRYRQLLQLLLHLPRQVLVRELQEPFVDHAPQPVLSKTLQHFRTCTVVSLEAEVDIADPLRGEELEWDLPQQSGQDARHLLAW